MNEKRSAICGLIFYEISAVSFDSMIGARDARLTILSPGIELPVVGASLTENHSTRGSFVDVEFSARISNTSEPMEKTILQVWHPVLQSSSQTILPKSHKISIRI